MIISPLQARRWLKTCQKCGINSVRAVIYAEIIESGEWGKSDTPIEFRNGILVNGKHRLMAIALSGKEMDMEVKSDTNILP